MRARALGAVAAGVIVAAPVATAIGAAPAAAAGHVPAVSAAPVAAPVTSASPGEQHRPATPIRHIIFLMQGGRTFDNYFGTYPGADGLPRGACQLFILGRPQNGCVRPFLLPGGQPQPLGGGRALITGQYDHGKMDGFVAAYHRQGRDGTSAMGYYNDEQLPFYWAVAHQYVLFDHFFSSTLYGTRANRSYWVAAAPPPVSARQIHRNGYGKQLTIFDRLQAAGVSWKFYVQRYNRHQTYRNMSPANVSTQTVRVPVLNYRRFIDNRALRGNIVGLGQYYRDLAAGTLPAVSFIASSAGSDERSSRTIAAGQNLVRNLSTQLMQSRYWASSALIWTYDGSGGLYDHVRPPRVAGARLGFRVPALLISAYARRALVDHAVLDYGSVLKFIESNWRLKPLTTRDALAPSLAGAFDFAAAPRPAVIIRPVSSALLPRSPVRQPSALMIYLLYGAAGGAAVLLVLLAVARSVLDDRHRYRSMRRAGRTGAEDT